MVNKWTYDENIPSKDWPYPKIENKSNILYGSGIHNSHSIAISPESLNTCWEGTLNNCKLLISISYIFEES